MMSLISLTRCLNAIKLGEASNNARVGTFIPEPPN